MNTISSVLLCIVEEYMYAAVYIIRRSSPAARRKKTKMGWLVAETDELIGKTEIRERSRRGEGASEPSTPLFLYIPSYIYGI